MVAEKMNRRMGICTIVFLCCVLSLRAGAYTLERVPSDHASIQAAIDAVSPGGTVLIEDSAVYEEDLVIQTANIRIVAASGENPTIRYAGGHSYIIYADQPCRVGSNTGGRIKIDGNRNGPGTQTHIFRPVHISGEVRIENADVVNVRNNQVLFPDGSTGDVTLNNVAIDGGGLLQFAIRVDFLNSVLTLNCVTLTNCARECLFSGNPATGIINVFNSVLSAGFDVVFFDFQAGGYTLNIRDSLINETGGGGAFSAFYTRAPLTINMSHSVIRTADIDAFGFYHFDDQAGTGPVTLTADHCDFVADFPLRLLSSTAANNYTLTNCNLVHGPTPSRGQLLGGAAGGDDTFTWNYNNIPSNSYDAFPSGANDIHIDPGYTNVAGGDFTYSDPTVLVSDDTGGPVGTTYSFPTSYCSVDFVVHVPSDYPSIQAAINATPPYGVVRIENSATYTESLLIETPGITIEAAPCESPLIRYGGVESYLIRTTVPCQIGSNSGGRIRIDSDLGGPGSLSRVLDPRHTSGEVIFENLSLDNMRNTYMFRPEATAGDVTMNNVDADGHDPGLGMPIVQFPIRLDNLNSTLTLNYCNVRRMARDAIFFAGSATGVLNIIDSVVESGFDTIFLDFAVGGFTINIDGSYINETGGGGAFSCFFVRGPNTINMKDSVLRTADFDGFGFYHFDDQAGAGPVVANFDHCDFVADFPLRLLTSFSANIYTATECNFVQGPTASGRGQLLGGAGGGDDTFVWDYNNVVSNSYDTFPVGAHDIHINPLYGSFSAGNFSYTDPTVLVSDSSGYPLGTNRDYRPSVSLSTASLDYTQGTGYEVDVVAPDNTPAAQPKSQPVHVFSQAVRNVVITSLTLKGPNAADWNILCPAPIIVNKSSPASIRIEFDPQETLPTYGLQATLEIGTSDAANPLIVVALEGDAVGGAPSSVPDWSLYE
ncbi:MAG: hypothetical protein HUU36_11715 [Candidatus Omnitrophica bacterium]|nr:hypothetical protein [Candidatus Omnitrophota bacterium]